MSGAPSAPLQHDAPLRVAFVVTRSDSVGGASIHVRDLARWLRARGDDAHVLVGGTGPYTELLDDADVPFTCVAALQRELRPGRDLRAAAELLSALRRLRPDVLSLHTAKAGALGRLVAPLARLRPLYTPHGWAFTSGVPEAEARRYRRLERWLARWPGQIVNVCAFERDVALVAGVGRADQHMVVHNGVPERPDVPLATPEGGPACNCAHLVMVARFEPQKDHGTLLRALALVGRDADWRLSLVGDGPLRAAIEALAIDLGLAHRVRFVGALTDVAPTLAAAQLFVLATRWEGFPRSILEAMRAGLPVIASRVGGVHEAVEDGVSGLLTEPGDVAGMAAALRRMLERPVLRATMGAEGRTRYLAEFTFDRMAATMLDVYRRHARAARAQRG